MHVIFGHICGHEYVLLITASQLGECPIAIRFVRLSVRPSVRQHFDSDMITW